MKRNTLLISAILVAGFSVNGFSQKRKQPASETAHSRNPTEVCGLSKVPTGYVVVSAQTGGRCGDLPTLNIKKPGPSEAVCDGSPIPSGYSVVRTDSNLGCRALGGSPLANVLLIAKDGATFSAASSNSAYSAVGVNRKYDRFEDRTIVRMGEVFLSRAPSTGTHIDSNELFLSAAFAYRGEQPSRPNKVMIVVRERSFLSFLKSASSAVFLADGRRIPASDVSTSFDSEAKQGPNGTFTSYDIVRIGMSVSLEEFRAIAGARSAEVRIGGQVIALDSNALGPLRGFLQQIP